MKKPEQSSRPTKELRRTSPKFTPRPADTRSADAGKYESDSESNGKRPLRRPPKRRKKRATSARRLDLSSLEPQDEPAVDIVELPEVIPEGARAQTPRTVTRYDLRKHPPLSRKAREAGWYTPRKSSPESAAAKSSDDTSQASKVTKILKQHTEMIQRQTAISAELLEQAQARALATTQSEMEEARKIQQAEQEAEIRRIFGRTEIATQHSPKVAAEKSAAEKPALDPPQRSQTTAQPLPKPDAKEPQPDTEDPFGRTKAATQHSPRPGTSDTKSDPTSRAASSKDKKV